MKRRALYGLMAVSQLLVGYTMVNQLIDWRYHGTPVASKFFDSSGKPTITEFTATLPGNLPALPSNLVSKINYTLPEGKDIRLNPQGLMPDSDDKTNIHFTQAAEAWVTFLREGAGYRNAVGYFKYKTANPPLNRSEVQEHILFANASMPSPLTAATTTGNTVYLGNFEAGESLGFMIVADGWSTSGRTVNGVRVAGVKDYADPKAIFYTLRHLNPEVADARNLNTHTLILKELSNSEPGYQSMVIGFADINREVGGDNDFNDVVLAIHITPKTAISNLAQINTLVASTDPDSDGDGVKDSLDEFPSDASKALSHWYPSQNTWGTLAFEDNWPLKGDYDLNDVVIRYRTREIMNAARQVVGVNIDYRLDAHGGIIRSGFAVQLPASSAQVSSADLQLNTDAAQAIAPESGQNSALFILFNDITAHARQTQGGCQFFNTENHCVRLAPSQFQLRVNFTTPLASSLFTSPYNPFIFRTSNRGQETHLPGKAPSSKASNDLFGSADDRSVIGSSNTYMTAQRLPWALDFPTEWVYPSEKVDIVRSHPKIVSWAESAGSTDKDWYFNNLVSSLLYHGK